MSISHSTKSDKNFPEIDDLKDLQEALFKILLSKDYSQWQPSQIGTKNGVKTLNAYKGTAEGYLFQRREELHLMRNMSDSIEFESMMEDVTELFQSGELSAAQSKLDIYVSTYLEQHGEEALQTILSELPEEQVEMYQAIINNPLTNSSGNVL